MVYEKIQLFIKFCSCSWLIHTCPNRLYVVKFSFKIFSQDVDPMKNFQHENFSNKNFIIITQISLLSLLNFVHQV